MKRIIFLNVVGFLAFLSPWVCKEAVETANTQEDKKIVVAMTDWTCMSDCQDKGYSYFYCKKICSY